MPLNFRIPAMSCSHCVAVITKAVQSVDATARVDADLAAHTVTVASALPASAFLPALTDAGYPPA